MRLNLRFPFPSFFFLYHYVILESYFLGRVRVFFFFSWPISFFLESYLFFLEREGIFFLLEILTSVHSLFLTWETSLWFFFLQIFCRDILHDQIMSHRIGMFITQVCIYLFFQRKKKHFSCTWLTSICMFD